MNQEREVQGKRRRRRRRPPVLRTIVLQLLLTGLVLCVFALFHHVIPRLRMQRQESFEPIGTVERTTPPPTAAPTPAPEGAEDPAEPSPEPETPRFAEYFTEETVKTESSYSSPRVAVTVEKVEHSDSFPKLTYYVADIYVSDVTYLKTGTPQKSTFASGEWIAECNGAILGVNGDSMLSSHDGFVVRNGDIYMNTFSSLDICVLYYDGSMEIYGPEEYTIDEILAREPYQVWQFGPSLLDAEGQPLEDFNVSRSLRGVHPRTAIGYYEPGHYCLVVVDGRQGSYSAGADIETLARLMSELGCRIAYNFDGGDSSIMVFDGQKVNKPSGKRYISDMFLLTDPVTEGEETP